MDKNSQTLAEETEVGEETTSSSHEIQRLLSRTVRLGFAMVLALTLILGLVGLYQLNSVRVSMDQIVEINNKKTALAYAMRDAIRLRSLSITKIRAIDDAFERDEELMRFYGHAKKYREAREHLDTMNMDQFEKNTFMALSEHVRASQPLNRKAAEMLANSDDKKGSLEFELALDQAQDEQRALLDLLDKSVELQTQYTENAVITARNKFQFTLYMMGALLAVLLALGLYIARKVSKYVNKTNQILNTKTQVIVSASNDAKEATLAKSRFLANMSHEIRTPLTAIIGYSEILLDPNEASDELDNAARRINRNGIHLHQIINDVLDISKIEAGEIEVELLSISPLELVDDVLDMVAESADKKGIDLRCKYHFPIPKNISSDQTRIKQILLNILSNAMKFTNEGSVIVEVSYLKSVSKLQYIVRDTGIGMISDEVDVIFQPFSQANQTTTRKFGGTGLGLTISKQLANKLGGDVICQSKEGKGTTFIITVDVGADITCFYENQNELLGKTKPVEGNKAHTQLTGKVLLVDDCPDTRQLIALYVSRVGITAHELEDGQQAVEHCKNEKYDLILMDTLMPNMDGIEAIKTLRSMGVTTPIISLTANALKEDEEKSKNAGANGYVSKPINVKQFYQVLSEFLGGNLSQNKGVDISEDEDYEKSISELRSKFIKELDATVEEINNLAYKRKWEQLQWRAHKLKSYGGSFGFPQVSKISKEIMQCAITHNKQQLLDYVSQLNDVCSMIINYEVSKDKKVG